MAVRTIKLTIAALGGQGGGVLTDWLLATAEANGFIAQSTSVPGVAQRTGATIYYLEFFPRAEAERAGREPVMALMPVAGDVDCVVASELAEAGRAITRGLVTERTTLIASSHRAFAISEKSALGRGAADPQRLLELVRMHGKRTIVFDMEQTAERHQSLISPVLLGAISGAGVVPFAPESFEAAISHSGLAVAPNLAAFKDAFQQARAGCSEGGGARAAAFREVPQTATRPALQPLLDRIHAMPAAVQPLVLEGVRRTLDYQDTAYAALYLARLERIAECSQGGVAAGSYALLEATARSLALWMTFEDTIRVADLKTRAARFARVRDEIRADPGQLFGVTEFVKPRVAEVAGTLPARLGSWVEDSPRVQAWLSCFTNGRQIRTRTVSGFMLLYVLAGLRRWRRGTLRFRVENRRIEAWLADIEQLAPTRYALAVELARAQRLIKGYGDTHERGWRNFCALREQLEVLAARTDGAEQLARLQEAALADEEGSALERELSALGSTVPQDGAARSYAGRRA